VGSFMSFLDRSKWVTADGLCLGWVFGKGGWRVSKRDQVRRF
jgi:hypothetical protein